MVRLFQILPRDAQHNTGLVIQLPNIQRQKLCHMTAANIRMVEMSSAIPPITLGAEAATGEVDTVVVIELVNDEFAVVTAAGVDVVTGAEVSESVTALDQVPVTPVVATVLVPIARPSS